MIAELEQLLSGARASGVLVNASVAVYVDGAEWLQTGLGDARAAFDVASVTKAVSSVAVLQRAVPDARVSWLDGAPTVAQLLSHASGLPAWRPLFAHAAMALGVSTAELVNRSELHARARSIYRGVVAATPADAPRPTYSDLGMFALGEWFEDTFATPISRARDALVPSAGKGVGTGRGRARTGNPDVERTLEARAGHDPEAEDDAADDDNAACVGGECAHAGLFATASQLAAFGDRLRRDAEDGTGHLLDRELARAMFTPRAGSRTLGLDTPSGASPAIGSVLGRGPKGAAGHAGFTGCSLWIDRDARASIAILTDAVRCARPSPAIRELRPRLHDAIGRALGA